MPIKLIYGLSGSGKTEYCFNIAKDCAKLGKNVLYITPEHICLQIEKDISKIPQSQNVFVTGFMRLATTVFLKYGPILCDFVDDSTKSMMIKKLLLKHSKNLSVLSSYENDLNFSKCLLDTINSLKSALVTPDDLREIAKDYSNMISKLKLTELAYLYEKYNLIFSDNTYDSSDSLPLLCEKIQKFNLYCGYTVIIDGFNGFSKQQYQVITELMKNAENVYLTCCTDTLNENTNSVFFRGITVANKIFNIAYENDIKVLPNLYLDKCLRYNNSELLHLNNNLFKYPPVVYNEKTENIGLFKADDYYDEVSFVASEIYRLSRDFNYRYNDFAVVHRNTNVYNSIIKKVFSDYEIPIYLSEKINCMMNPFVSDLLHAFDVVINNFSKNSLIKWTKCDFHQDKKLCWIMENYLIASGSSEKMWQNELTYKGDLSDEEFDYLKEHFNEILGGLFEFKSSLAGRKDFVKISEAFINLIRYYNCEQYINNKYEEFSDLQQAKQYITVYNILTDVINTMCTVFSNDQITLLKYYEILKSGLASYSIGQIPPSLDSVTISETDLFKEDKKVVFVIGVNEGIMPKGYINEGLITEQDKEQLIKAGFDAPDTTVVKQKAESFLLYSAFTAPAHKLYLSYSCNDFDGNTLEKSRIIQNIVDIFPNITVLQNNTTVDAVVPTFNRIIVNENKEIEEWFRKNQPSKYEIINTARNYSNNPQMLREDIVNNLYGATPYFSISKIEQYNKCPYSYFLKYGLKARTRKENVAKIVDIGSVMHEVIENYTKHFKDEGFSTVTKEMCNKMANDLSNETIKEFFGDAFFESIEGKTAVKKISNILKGVLWNITDYYKNSKFEMYGSEVAFGGKDGEFPPIDITLEDGTCAHFTGKIDRVDLYMADNVNYVNVVDYKSGDKNIDYAQALFGIQIQLPVYIDAICKFLTEKTKVLTVPASILYCKIDYAPVSGKRDDTDEKIFEKLREALKMKGIVVDELETKSAIGETFVVKPDADRKEIEIMCKTAYKKISSTVGEIMSGKIELSPANIYGNAVCQYCDFLSVCSFDSCFNNKERTVNKISKEEYFNHVGKMDW